jgi:ABC-type transporter MlaC component
MSDELEIQKSVQEELRSFLSTIKHDRSEVAQKLRELDNKLDGIAPQLEALREAQRATSDRLRQEFTAALDAQRRELQNYFVAKAEFVPYQQAILAKLTEYDNLIAEQRRELPTYYAIINDVKLLKEAQAQLSKRPGEVLSRILSVVAVLISGALLLLDILQHLSFHP